VFSETLSLCSSLKVTDQVSREDIYMILIFLMILQLFGKSTDTLPL
jgi:hypothetical protein